MLSNSIVPQYFRFGSMYFVLPRKDDMKVFSKDDLKEKRVHKEFQFRLVLYSNVKKACTIYQIVFSDSARMLFL